MCSSLAPAVRVSGSVACKTDIGLGGEVQDVAGGVEKRRAGGSEPSTESSKFWRRVKTVQAERDFVFVIYPPRTIRRFLKRAPTPAPARTGRGGAATRPVALPLAALESARRFEPFFAPICAVSSFHDTTSLCGHRKRGHKDEPCTEQVGLNCPERHIKNTMQVMLRLAAPLRPYLLRPSLCHAHPTIGNEDQQGPVRDLKRPRRDSLGLLGEGVGDPGFASLEKKHCGPCVVLGGLRQLGTLAEWGVEGLQPEGSHDCIQHLPREANMEAEHHGSTKDRRTHNVAALPLATDASSVFGWRCLEQPRCDMWLGALGMRRPS